MKKEFNLSEKIVGIPKIIHLKELKEDDAEVLCKPDVKEFIELLKGKTEKCCKTVTDMGDTWTAKIFKAIIWEIDKLAGDDLK